MEFFEYHTKVQYSDLGEDGFLSAVGMLRLMQEAACEDSASVGCAPGELLEARGIGWVLCGWKLQLGQKAPWGTKLTVRTWPRRMDLHFSDRDFHILDEAGQTVAAATSRWLLLDVHTGRVTRVTEELASHYTLWDHKAVEGEIPMGGKTPEDAEETFLDLASLLSDGEQLVAPRVEEAASREASQAQEARDDGRVEYEGKIVYGGMEYEFEIDGYSGAIRSWEAEPVHG